MNLDEIWKDVIGYEGCYQVSNLGGLKSISRKVKGRVGNIVIKKEKVMKQPLSSGAYVRVSLCKNGSVKSFSLHRLIAEAFILNPENKPQVNHINGVKSDNRLDNLEWSTVSDNSKHAIGLGLITMSHIKKKVINTQSGRIYSSATEANNETNYSISYLCAMLGGIKKNKTNLKYI